MKSPLRSPQRCLSFHSRIALNPADGGEGRDHASCNWYNETHRHSALRYVTPSQRHRGEDIAILAQRHELYQDARDKHPERWSGKTRNWQPDHRRRSGRHRSHPKLSLALFGYLDILSPQELADIVRIIDLWLRERTDDE